MKKLLFLVISNLVLLPFVNAQMGQRLTTSINIKGSQTINYETEIPMLIVDAANSLFDPGDLVAAYPELSVAMDKISLKLPDLEAYSDTLYMMMLVKDRAYSKQGIVNIVVIGVYNEERLDYFIDNNSDYYFSDEEARFTFSPAVESVKLDMITRSGSDNEFYLFNPIYEPTLTTPPTTVFNGSWDRIDNKVSFLLDLSGAFGSGNSSLKYAPLSPTVVLQDYDAIIFAFGLFRAGLVADWKNINLGIYGGFEQVQYTERNKFSYTSTGAEHIDYMAGLWMWSKLSAELIAEYDFKINSRVKIGPVVGAGIWMPIDKRVFDPDLNPPPDAAYKDTWKYEYGAKMKLLINDYSFFTLKFGRVISNFDALDYIVDYEADYNLTYTQGYLSLGYAVLLSNRK